MNNIFRKDDINSSPMDTGSNTRTGSFEGVPGFDHVEFLPFAESGAKHTSGHFVQFYEDDAFLVKMVGAFIGAGIQNGNGGLVIATKSHRIGLEQQFRARKIDLDLVLSAEQLVFLDAEETLAKFMAGDYPDKNNFQKVVGNILGRLGEGRNGVRVFGEMVALLWRAGNHSAAIKLEGFWNDLSRVHSFSLLCAYPFHDFDGAADETAFSRICQEHSHVLPLENYTAATPSFDQHMRAIALLQQRANALEAELWKRRGAEIATKRLAAIVESSDDAIIFKDVNGIIKTWNKGAERIFGYTAEEVVDKSVMVLIPEDHKDEEPGILARIRRGERVDHYETIRRHKDGRLINISLTVSPVKDDQGNIIGASKIARDISDRKRIELALAKSLEAEKAATRMKDNFLATLSHELRTPLNPVLLIASDCAADPEVPAEIRAQFETILQNVEVEVRLIDDLLDLTRINHGKLNLSVGSVDAHAVLEKAIQTVQAQIDSKRIHAIINLQAKRHFISADSVRLQQIFWNILKNAVKFTPEGGTITIQTASYGEAGKFEVKIADTGIGMLPNELERVFSAFAQGDHICDKSANYGGLGLGLTISKKLVELHSGRIEAASEGRNKGTLFTIEFPLPAN